MIMSYVHAVKSAMMLQNAASSGGTFPPPNYLTTTALAYPTTAPSELVTLTDQDGTNLGTAGVSAGR